MSDNEYEEEYDEYDQEPDDVNDDFLEQERLEDTYKEQGRATHGEDEGWKDLANREFIGDYPMYQTPEQVFKATVTQILTTDLFKLDKRDKQIIVGHLDTMNWKLFKIPTMYVAGYYLNKHKMSESAMKQIVATAGPDLFLHVKYARYWSSIL